MTIFKPKRVYFDTRPLTPPGFPERRSGLDLEDHFAFLLRSCDDPRHLSKGRKIHEDITGLGLEKKSTFIANLLLQMYSKCGRLDEARKVFDGIQEQNSFSYNLMLAGYSQSGQLREMEQLFNRMPNKTEVTWNTMIQAYAQNGYMERARGLFEKMQVKPVRACNMLIHGYAQSGDMVQAKSLFDDLGKPSVCSWCTLIQGYARNGHLRGAKKSFDMMSEKNSVAWVTMLQAFAQFGEVQQAGDLFERLPQRNVVAWTIMSTSYAQHGHLEDARSVFREMPEKNVVTWTALMGAYSQGLDLRGAKNVFERMPEWNQVSLNSWLVANAQCGQLEEAQKFFNSMPDRDVNSWTTMVAAYAQSGYGRKAIELFLEMVLEGFLPDKITFMSVLNACSHTGEVEESIGYFRQMIGDYGIDEPMKDHYCTMVDIFGRAGQLANAEDLITNMPFLPDAVAWGALLAGCKTHKNVECAERAAEHVLQLDPENAAPYVLLSNIYAAAGRHKDVSRVRKIMQEKGVVKLTGISYVEVENQLHRFAAGDRTHARNEEIRAELERLFLLLREAGYVPDTTEVLRNVTHDEKKEMLKYHSEKMAVAYALISTEAGSPISIMKNLRVCCDCHAAMKLISSVCKRRIVVRDTSRFHHFENGNCSCKDYW